MTRADLDAIAVTNRPGLMGGLLIGVTAAKTLAWSLGVPLIGVDHLSGHIYAAAMCSDKPVFPAIALVVSGGHTSLFACRSAIDRDLLGPAERNTVTFAIGDIRVVGSDMMDAKAAPGDISNSVSVIMDGHYYYTCDEDEEEYEEDGEDEEDGDWDGEEE